MLAALPFVVLLLLLLPFIIPAALSVLFALWAAAKAGEIVLLRVHAALRAVLVVGMLSLWSLGGFHGANWLKGQGVGEGLLIPLGLGWLVGLAVMPANVLMALSHEKKK